MSKRETITEFLRRGLSYVLVDARQLGVTVPEHLRQSDLLLRLSYRFAPHDLQFNDRGIECTLSFDRQPFLVVLPWSAIYAARCGDDTAAWEAPPEPVAVAKRRGGLGLVS